MSARLLDRLARRLARAHTEEPGLRAYVLALSGGVDSVTLLAALCRLGLAARLRCVHIDHGLQPESGRWAEFCGRLAARHGVACETRRISCEPAAGASPEAAARVARYAALAQQLHAGEALLTAHHADDQLETLLYRLVRGTGVEGLAGIRERMPLGAGHLLRPWLDVTRAQIRAQAHAWGLQWLEDPSNADVRFDRNYLRSAVLPALLRRWPDAPAAAARLAEAANDARELAGALARADLQAVDALDCLPLERLGALSPARVRNALRHAMRTLGLPPPGAAALARVVALCGPAPQHRCAAWSGAEAHRYRGYLYLRAARPALPEPAGSLSPAHACPVGEGRLELESAGAPALPDAWIRQGLSVRFRAGGERFQSADGRTALSLREWLRVHRVLPWMRERIPLVFCGGDLVAVADIGISAAAAHAGAGEAGWRIVWRERPRTCAPEAA